MVSLGRGGDGSFRRCWLQQIDGDWYLTKARNGDDWKISRREGERDLSPVRSGSALLPIPVDVDRDTFCLLSLPVASSSVSVGMKQGGQAKYFGLWFGVHLSSLN